MSSCFLPTIWAKMIIPSNNTFWQEQGARDSLLEFSRGYKLVQSLCKTICHYLVTLRAHVLTVPALPLSGAHPGDSPALLHLERVRERNQHRGACHSKTLEMYTRSRICTHSLAESHSPVLFSFENKPSTGSDNNTGESQQSSSEPRSRDKRAGTTAQRRVHS